MRDYSTAVNRTCREKGAVGKAPICYRYVIEGFNISNTILDFGAGRSAVHTRALREAGFKQVIAFDIGENFNPEVHLSGALRYRYDLVIASNVLNVQPDRVWLHWVMSTLRNCTKKDGVTIANYPRSPRKAGVGKDELKELFQYYFGNVVELSGGLFMCGQPIVREK